MEYSVAIPAVQGHPFALPAPECRQEDPTRQTIALLGIAFLLYVPLIFLGFGANIDSQRIAETGRAFMATGVYTPSRYPGFPVHEIPAALLAWLGGATLSNFGSMVMAMAGAYSFLRLLEHYRIGHRSILTLGLVANPMYWTAATYTIDYVWSLSLLLAGFALVRYRYYLIGAAVFGLATGSRATSLGFAMVVMAMQFAADRDGRSRLLAGIGIMFALAIIAFAPTVYSMGWLRLYFGDWSRLDHLANFIYGNLLFAGPQALLALPFVIALSRRQTVFDASWRPLAWSCAAIITGYEALFLSAPLQTGYLLPTLPCMLILIGLGLRDRPRLLASWVALSASAAIISVNIISVSGGLHRVEADLPPLVARDVVTIRGNATTLSAGMFVRWGHVASETSARWQSISAGTRPE